MPRYFPDCKQQIRGPLRPIPPVFPHEPPQHSLKGAIKSFDQPIGLRVAYRDPQGLDPQHLSHGLKDLAHKGGSLVGDVLLGISTQEKTWASSRTMVSTRIFQSGMASGCYVA